MNGDDDTKARMTITTPPRHGKRAALEREQEAARATNAAPRAETVRVEKRGVVQRPAGLTALDGVRWIRRPGASLFHLYRWTVPEDPILGSMVSLCEKHGTPPAPRQAKGMGAVNPTKGSEYGPSWQIPDKLRCGTCRRRAPETPLSHLAGQARRTCPHGVEPHADGGGIDCEPCMDAARASAREPGTVPEPCSTERGCGTASTSSTSPGEGTSASAPSTSAEREPVQDAAATVRPEAPAAVTVQEAQP